MTVIQVYDPTADAEEQVDEFNSQVQSENNRTCKHDRLETKMPKEEIVGRKTAG